MKKKKKTLHYFKKPIGKIVNIIIGPTLIITAATENITIL